MKKTILLSIVSLSLVAISSTALTIGHSFFVDSKNADAGSDTNINISVDYSNASGTEFVLTYKEKNIDSLSYVSRYDTCTYHKWTTHADASLLIIPTIVNPGDTPIITDTTTTPVTIDTNQSTVTVNDRYVKFKCPIEGCSQVFQENIDSSETYTDDDYIGASSLTLHKPGNAEEVSTAANTAFTNLKGHLNETHLSNTPTKKNISFNFVDLNPSFQGHPYASDSKTTYTSLDKYDHEQLTSVSAYNTIKNNSDVTDITPYWSNITTRIKNPDYNTDDDPLGLNDLCTQYTTNTDHYKDVILTYRWDPRSETFQDEASANTKKAQIDADSNKYKDSKITQL